MTRFALCFAAVLALWVGLIFWFAGPAETPGSGHCPSCGWAYVFPKEQLSPGVQVLLAVPCDQCGKTALVRDWLQPSRQSE